MSQRTARATLVVNAGRDDALTGTYATRDDIKAALRTSVLSGGGRLIGEYSFSDKLVPEGLCSDCPGDPGERQPKHYHFEASATVEE